jgi:hypothetical protein
MNTDKPVKRTLPQTLPGTTAGVVLATLCAGGCDSGNNLEAARHEGYGTPDPAREHVSLQGMDIPTGIPPATEMHQPRNSKSI